jgi:CDP-4-dehydro-6-deoxyglucose reductase, E1
MKKSPKEILEEKIFRLTEEYYQLVHSGKEFIPGITKIGYSGRVFDQEDMIEGIKSILDYWLTSGPFTQKFENLMKEYFDCSQALLVNSGSSANLLMIASLCSKNVANHLTKGDEVITPAVTFPTTLTPIIQNNLVPVFVDCKPGEYNIDPNKIEEAITDKTKCIFIPHTVGIPANMDIITQIANKYNLFLLEDGCDCLGAKWDGKLLGTFGDMSSISFYPAHHMTMGEGGMVIVNNRLFRKTALSIRDWGRDCWCEPGNNNTCGKRFDWQLGELPYGYDHKYIYSNLGYNMKATDMQAALGCSQFKKLPSFIKTRQENAKYYLEAFSDLSTYFILPDIPAKAEPSWFGFPITVRKDVDKLKFVEFLENAKIETRQVFGGNILKQPGFRDITHRVSGNLVGTNTIMERTIFFGVYPGITPEMREYVADKVRSFFKN